ncbi:MAG: PilZ domain-containing protein [Desulfobacteraceae bacterium]|nr:PilZ domain-containing protein [Desulfobacteraceae bacterium]
MATEKRDYPRVHFDLEEGFIGDFRLPSEEQLTALIMNISGGGAGLAVVTRFVEKLGIGDTLVLKKIVGAVNLEFLSDIQAQVQWIKNIDSSGYVGAGCIFIDLPRKTLEQLLKFIESERKFRGQYD